MADRMANPAAQDRHAGARPDEPVFTPLGRDPVAADVIRFWIRKRRERALETLGDFTAAELKREQAEWEAADRRASDMDSYFLGLIIHGKGR